MRERLNLFAKERERERERERARTRYRKFDEPIPICTLKGTIDSGLCPIKFVEFYDILPFRAAIINVAFLRSSPSKDPRGTRQFKLHYYAEFD